MPDKNVITSEEDIKSNARETNGDVTKGDDIKKDIYNHSYNGDNINTNLSIGNNDWSAPIIGNDSFWEYVQNKSGAGMADNLLDEYTVSPESGFGSSYYDQFIHNREDYDDINEMRAREQGVVSTFASGAFNFGVKTGTSFVSSFLSGINGTYQGIMNLADEDENTTFLSGFVDNYTQEVVKDINDWAEEIAPIYTGQKYQDMNSFRKLLTSTYWAQQLDNMGFTSGMILAAMVPFGQGSLFGRAGSFLASKLGASAKTADTIYRFVAGTTMAIPEASMQGYNLYKENQSKNINEVDDKYSRELSYLRKQIENEDTMYALTGFEEHLNNSNQLKELYEQKKVEYDNEAQRAEQRALDAGVAAFGMNMAILPISNTIGALSFLRTGSSNANRLVKGAFGNSFRSVGAKKGISTAEARLTGAREIISEGLEEMNQGWADNLATEYYGMDYDPESTENFARFLDKAKSTFISTYTDKSVIEEGIAGAIMGLTGAIAPHRDANGKFRLFQGGLREAWREGKELAERSQQTFNDMNKVINDENLRNQVKLAIANLSATRKQMELAGTGDKKGYIDKQNQLGIKTIQTFANAGRLNDLEALVGEPMKMSDDEMKNLATMFAVPDTNRPGKFIPDNEFVDENGELIPFSSNEMKENLRDKLETKQKEFKRLIKDYRDALYEADKMTNFQLGQDQLNMLVWGVTQNKNWRNRISDMYELPEFKEGLEEIQKNNTRLIQLADEARIQREKDIKSQNITSKSKMVVDQAIKDRGEYLDQMYNASIAFIEKHAQEIEREADELDKKASELEKQSEEYTNAGYAFSEAEKRKKANQKRVLLRRIKEKQERIKKIKSDLNKAQKGLNTPYNSLYDEYIKQMRSFVEDIKELENSISNDYDKRERVTEESKRNRQEILKNAQEKSDESLLQSWETKGLADSKRQEAIDTRTKELADFKESGEYTRENDDVYQRRKSKQNELSKKLDYLAGLIEEATATIEKGELAESNNAQLKSLGITDRIGKIKNLEELMHLINSGNLLKRMRDPNASDIFDELIELMNLCEGVDPVLQEKFAQLVMDMKKCMASYNQMDALIKEFVANPNKITSIQNNVKNQVASRAAKATTEALDEELRQFDYIEEDSIVGEDDKIGNESFSRLDDSQLKDLGDKYRFLKERAEEMLNRQLLILNWPKEKREQYAKRVINKAVRDRREKNENFDNFLNALELSDKFSELFEDIVEHVNFQGIDIANIQHLARQLFETSNLYAYAHGFHPIFLSADEIASLLDTMSDDVNKYSLDNDEVAAAYICVNKIFDVMRNSLRKAKANNNTSSVINNGQITDLNNGEKYSVDNPTDSNNKSEHTRDNTSQITGITVIGNLDDIIIHTTSNPVAPTPSNPPVSPQNPPQQPPQNAGDGQQNPGLRRDYTDDELQRKALGLVILDPQRDFQALNNRSSNVLDYNQQAVEYMKQNGGYDFVNQGKLRELLEATGGNVNVYAQRIQGIGTYDMPVVFFFVDDKDGKKQVIGYISNTSKTSRINRSILYSNRNERFTSQYDGEYVSENRLVSTNINLRSDIVVGYEPVRLFNDNNQPLKIVKVGNQKGIMLKVTRNVSEIPVGEKSFSEAAKDGDVAILWNEKIIGKEGISYNSRGLTRPSILYKGDDGNYHHQNCIAAPLQVALENDDSSITKVFKKSLRKALDKTVSEFKEAYPNAQFNDFRDISNLTSGQQLKLNQILCKNLKDFTFDNTYTKNMFISYDTDGSKHNSPYITSNAYEQNGVTQLVITYSVTDKDQKNRKLFEIPVNIIENNNSFMGADTDTYYNHIINDLVDGYKEQSRVKVDNDGKPVFDSNGKAVKESNLNDIDYDAKDYSEKHILIKLNAEFADDYNIDDVSNALLSSARDFRPENTSVAMTYQDANIPFNNDSITWSGAARIGNNEFAANKDENKIDIAGTKYHFKRNKASNGALTNEWTIYSGKSTDPDVRDSNPIEPSLFLDKFDPDGLLDNDNNKLNEVLTSLFKYDISKRNERFVKTPYGYFDKVFGIMTNEVSGEVFDPNNPSEQKVEPTPSKTKIQKTPPTNQPEQKAKPETNKTSSGDNNNSGDVDFNDLDSIDFSRESTESEGNSIVRLQNGLYNGVLLIRQIKDKMFNKIKNLDAQLLDFIENNISKRLRVKVLNDKQWAKFIELNPSASSSKAIYSPKNNCIYLRTNTDITTVAHEFTHAATVEMIRNAMANNNTSLNELNDILSYLQSASRENPELFKNIDGIRNFTKGNENDLFEMVAEIIANKDLQNLLKGVSIGKKTIKVSKNVEIQQTEPKSLFERFINWIKNLIHRNKPQYRTEFVDKIVDMTMFDKFKTNVIALQPVQKTQKSLSERINNKINRKSYNVQKVGSNDGITVYTSMNIGVTGQSINVSRFINKYDYNGSVNPEWTKLESDFNYLNDTNINLNDNSEFGKQNQKKFYDYLRSKGYEGVDLITGRDLAFTKYASDERLIVFNNSTTTSTNTVANRLNVKQEVVDNMNAENQYKLQHCI